MKKGVITAEIRIFFNLLYSSNTKNTNVIRNTSDVIKAIVANISYPNVKIKSDNSLKTRMSP